MTRGHEHHWEYKALQGGQHQISCVCGAYIGVRGSQIWVNTTRSLFEYTEQTYQPGKSVELTLMPAGLTGGKGDKPA